MLKKGAINENLWKTIMVQSRGSINEKIEAAKSILTNYRYVPDEADSLIKTLVSPTEEREVRKSITLEITKDDADIPYGLYTRILRILGKDPDQEIKSIIQAMIRSLPSLLYGRY